MITLHTFGARFGLPDPSSFVSKVEILLKMAGLEYVTKIGDPRKAPKGKLPYIEDNGKVIADSTLIRFYLEDTYSAKFDPGLSAEDLGVAWALEKMCEDHLYWIIIQDRWMIDDNFNKGPRVFFESVPMPFRLPVVAMVRRTIKRNLWGHGLGRHSPAEIEQLAVRDLEAISRVLGDKPWLMGANPCGADATVWSFVASALCPLFQASTLRAGQNFPNLPAYVKRGMDLWFPELAA